jgi:hypothetical protein
MDTLKWLAEYGLIDIFFGLGVVGFIATLIRRVLPSNYEYLHTSVAAGYEDCNTCRLIHADRLPSGHVKKEYRERSFSLC